jgi:hypothetical protein
VRGDCTRIARRLVCCKHTSCRSKGIAICEQIAFFSLVNSYVSQTFKNRKIPP